MSAVSPLLGEESDQPEGWAEICLGDLISRIEAGKNLRCREQPPVNGEKGIIKISAVTWGEFLEDESKTLDGNHNFNTIWQIRPGDFLISRANTIELVGACVIVRSVNRTLMLSDKVLRLQMPDEWKEWLLLFLRSSLGRFQIENLATGNQLSMRNISQGNMRRIVVPLPPFPEQKRIVEKLRQVLSCVSSARERLTNIPAVLKRFRQTVLAAACSGRLTADWRTRAADTKDIAAIIATIRERRESQANSPKGKERITQIYEQLEEGDSSELPEGWAFVRLNKLCSSFDYGTSARSQLSGKVPVLRMGNIQDGKIDWTDLVFTSDKDEIHQYELSPQTLLFNRTNSPELVGKTAIYLGERPAIFAGYLIKINHLPEIDPRYLNFCLNTNYARNFCSRVKTDAVSQSNINAQKLGTFEVPFCPLAEQQEIVRQVEALFKLADAIEERVSASTKRAKKLTQAILAKAFRGELVRTEAELARRENRSYETASDLLARIRSKRADEKQSSSLQKEKKWPTRSKRKTRNS
jgi:type I restriction enzyme S subunit